MNTINELISGLLPYTEGAMLTLLLGGGLFLALYSGFTPYRYFKHAIDITRGKYDKEGATGEVSHWQALSAAIASTVGLGNISGGGYRGVFGWTRCYFLDLDDCHLRNGH